jgi:hypothetical protein
MAGAPIAVATHICQPGEVIKSADQCTTVPDNNVNSTDGTPGKLMQSGRPLQLFSERLTPTVIGGGAATLGMGGRGRGR